MFLSRRLDSPASVNGLSVSDDGYIRLQFGLLQTIPLVHLISGLDDSNPITALEGAIPTEITGYTEWISNTVPAITIGWDWEMDADHGHILLRKTSVARSNILLQDLNGMDAGSAKTLDLLDTLVDELDWSIEVKKYIAARYRK